MVDHDRLIEKLSREARPVKRPWSDGWRVLAWILMALPCGVLGSLATGFDLRDGRHGDQKCIFAEYCRA